MRICLPKKTVMMRLKTLNLLPRKPKVVRRTQPLNGQRRTAHRCHRLHPETCLTVLQLLPYAACRSELSVNHGTRSTHPEVVRGSLLHHGQRRKCNPCLQHPMSPLLHLLRHKFMLCYFSSFLCFSYFFPVHFGVFGFYGQLCSIISLLYYLTYFRR